MRKPSTLRALALGSRESQAVGTVHVGCIGETDTVVPSSAYSSG